MLDSQSNPPPFPIPQDVPGECNSHVRMNNHALAIVHYKRRLYSLFPSLCDTQRGCTKTTHNGVKFPPFWHSGFMQLGLAKFDPQLVWKVSDQSGERSHDHKGVSSYIKAEHKEGLFALSRVLKHHCRPSPSHQDLHCVVLCAGVT